MDTREIDLLLERERLLARSAELRGRIGIEWHGLHRPPAWALVAQDGWRWLQANPAWLLGGAVALLLLRPRGVVRWGGRALAVWQLWRRVRPLWHAGRGGRP